MHALDLVCMSEDTAPQGLLAKVPPKLNGKSSNDTLPRWDSGLSLDEKIALRTASFLEPKPTHILFRRFGDNRSSVVVAYVVDNEVCKYTTEQIAKLHQNIWLSGATSLLYVGDASQVDIYSCVKSASMTKENHWTSEPTAIINKISNTLTQEYSAFRLIDGTFLDDPRNGKILTSASAHKMLVEKVHKADATLKGDKNPAARHILLLTLLLKYLEDRKVLTKDWFSIYVEEANSCIDVFRFGGQDATINMLQDLEKKFNGDIFQLDNTVKEQLTDDTLTLLATTLEAKVDAYGQIYFWNMFSFEYIPVEVLSHIYQQFADRTQGAIFTPHFMVNLLLDYAMPLKKLKGTEAILDPSCGSGIFLVAAFRRLIFVHLEKNNWQPLPPSALKKLLAKTIYGIEIQATASELTAFSLALALCDALQPDVIFKDLQFDKLLQHNIFTGDFSEALIQAKEKTPHKQGFDIILGNPPFTTSFTNNIKKYAKENKYNIPNMQTSYFFLQACLDNALAAQGILCMVQNEGFIYHDGTKQFREKLFEKYTFQIILDFVSIRKLFEGADPKVVAALVKKQLPAKDYNITHLTFRRTQSVKGKMFFELDYYDIHTVPSTLGKNNIWPWKANLLGGGRNIVLTQRLANIPTLQDFVSKNGWGMGEGFNTSPNNPRSYQWLEQLKFLPAKDLILSSNVELNKDILAKTGKRDFRGLQTISKYTAPLFLIHKNTGLSCMYWDKCDLAYNQQVVGIYGNGSNVKGLQEFSKNFLANKNTLIASSLLLGGRALSDKATALNLQNIYDLPWPADDNWDLVQWERELLADIANHMADYVRLGQNSKLLQKNANIDDLNNYCDTFLRLLRTSFPNIHACGSGFANGLIYQAFNFYHSKEFQWPSTNWAKYLYTTIYNTSRNNVSPLTTIRMLRYYDEDYIVIIKPDRLRYWIRSTAIRDVDDIVGDIMNRSNDANI